MNIDLKALRDAWRAEAADSDWVRENVTVLFAMADQIEATERRAEDAERERDEAVEEVRLLSTHCNGIDEQLAAVEKDADRYRWLRKGLPYRVETAKGKATYLVSPRPESDYADALDAALDAAMAQEALTSNLVESQQIEAGAGMVRVNGERGWNPLTDEDRQAAFESLPDMLDGFLKKWGWLHFAKEIERRCMEKNVAQEGGK